MWHAFKLLFDAEYALQTLICFMTLIVKKNKQKILFDWFGSRSTFNIGLTHKKFDSHESGTVEKKPSKWPSSKIAPCFQIQTDPISCFMVFCSWTILRALCFIDAIHTCCDRIRSDLVWWRGGCGGFVTPGKRVNSHLESDPDAEPCACHLLPSQASHFEWMLHKLRYESSTLILYKELSSSIFQSCQLVSQYGIGNTCPDLHFLQYIKAWMSSTDPVSSITNCYRLIVSSTDPVHSFIIS